MEKIKDKGGRPSKFGKGVKTMKLQAQVPVILYDEIIQELEIMIQIKMKKITNKKQTLN
jgi:hypothetical protein